MQTFKNFKPIILKEVSSLGGGELMKDLKGGGPRLAILRDLIARNVPLELVKGGTFVVTDKEAAELALKKYEKDQKPFTLFGGRDGKTQVKNTQLAKSAVFGGGSGGNNASGTSGGAYGGGGGGTSGGGHRGAVRIIWGPGRQYPAGTA